MSGGPYRTSSGNTVRLGPVLGGGGEGVAYDVEGRPDLAAKIYLPGKAAERRDKVISMAEAGWHASATVVAFPIEALFDQRSGTFEGFTMRKAGGHKPAHELYSPSSRKVEFPNATYPVLVRAVSNAARAIAAVHTTGCVIGDINHSGILVSPDATVTLIDSDSFQVDRNRRRFPCKVGVPEYTPPELQGQRLDAVNRTPNHDAFGLAVLAFHTLMMGRHPFSGVYNGRGGVPSLDRAIAEFRFAYSSRRASTEMSPPPHGPALSDLPVPIADAFERAFGRSGATTGRPTAAEWVTLLDRAEVDIVRCNQNSAHHHFRTAADCPWCRMEGAFPGFVAFAPTAPATPKPGQKTIDLGQLIAAVRGVPDPGPAPDLLALMPKGAALKPSAAAVQAARTRIKHWIGGAVGALIGVVMLIAGKSTLFPGLLLLGGSASFGLKTPSAFQAIRSTADKARAAWRNSQTAFTQAAGNDPFQKVQRDGESLLSQLQLLPTEEARRLAELNAKRRDAQLRRYLESHSIDRVKIKGIGNGRKLTLASFGIETAADIDRRRIEAIRGFGSSTAQPLVDWRRSLEAGFVFNPQLGVAPQDTAAIQADIARRRSDLASRVHQTVTLLKNAEAGAKAARASFIPNAVSIWSELQQAEADLKALADVGPRVVLTLFLGILALITVAGLSQSLRRTPKVATAALPSVPQQQSAPPTTPIALAPPPNQQLATLVKPPAYEPPLVPSEPQNSNNLAAEARQNTPAPGRLETRLAPIVSASAPTLPQSLPVAALPDPIDIKPPPIVTATQDPAFPSTVPLAGSSSDPLLDLVTSTGAERVQRRLSELGYFDGLVDGVWGPRSRGALRDFRRSNRLGLDDRWDAPTQSALFSALASRGSPGQSTTAAFSSLDANLPPPPGATRNPLNRADGLWIQSRLRTLGFYALDGEGVWGPASRAALRDFKAANGLPSDETWDAFTEQRLGARYGLVTASQTFMGGFAQSTADCTSGDGAAAPVVISRQGAEAFGGRCEFEEVHDEGVLSWRIRARCSARGKSWPANIRLALNGGELLWTSERGTVRYQRCR